MELPFIIVFEPPSRTELRALLRKRRTWAAGLLGGLAIGILVVAATSGRADAVADARGVPLDLSSQPPGAGVWLDGHPRGPAPLRAVVEPGVHDVAVQGGSQAVEARYAVDVGAQGARLDAVLWRRQPGLTRLRPSLPGAALSDARLLSDGRLALSVLLPPGRLLQAWRLDPGRGAVEPVLGEVAGTRLAVAPDDTRLAYLGFPVGPPGPGTDTSGFGSDRASVVWLVSGAGADPAATSTAAAAAGSGWSPPLARDERLTDLSWSPQSDRLLVVSAQGLPGSASRSRVWLMEADGVRASQRVSLPSQVVPGSLLWSPDGRHVVFVAHTASLNALCLIDLDEPSRPDDPDAGFRYLADLETAATPVAFPQASWSADSQRLVFVAPLQHPPGASLGWLQTAPRHALFVATIGDPLPQQIAETDVDAAAWREDGQLLGLGRRGTDGGLAINLLSGGAGGQPLLELPLKPQASYAVIWDLARARLLIADSTPSGNADYWLASLGLADE